MRCKWVTEYNRLDTSREECSIRKHGFILWFSFAPSQPSPPPPHTHFPPCSTARARCESNPIYSIINSSLGFRCLIQGWVFNLIWSQFLYQIIGRFFQKTSTSLKAMTAVVKCPVKQFLINQACPTALFPVIASLLTRQWNRLHQIVQKDSIRQLMTYMKSTGVTLELCLNIE